MEENNGLNLRKNENFMTNPYMMEDRFVGGINGAIQEFIGATGRSVADDIPLYMAEIESVEEIRGLFPVASPMEEDFDKEALLASLRVKETKEAFQMNDRFTEALYYIMVGGEGIKRRLHILYLNLEDKKTPGHLFQVYTEETFYMDPSTPPYSELPLKEYHHIVEAAFRKEYDRGVNIARSFIIPTIQQIIRGDNTPRPVFADGDFITFIPRDLRCLDWGCGFNDLASLSQDFPL